MRVVVSITILGLSPRKTRATRGSNAILTNPLTHSY